MQFAIFLSTGVLSMLLLAARSFTHCTGSLVAPVLNNLWVASLTWLFLVFYQRTYKKPAAAVKSD